jgi:Eukaryotic translation initiation factor 3 subunit 8 N-terminus
VVAKGKAGTKPAAPAGDGKPKYGRDFFRASGSGSESSSEDDGIDLEESASDDDEGDAGGKWFLKSKEPSSGPVKKKKKEKDQKVKAPKEEKVAQEKVVIKEMTQEQVEKKLVELLANRGKRGTDKQEQIEQLETLVPFAKTDAQLMAILMHVVSAQFDASPSVATHMPANLWKGATPNHYAQTHYLADFRRIHFLLGALANLSKIIGVLNRNPSLVLAESEESETPEEEGQVVVGNLLAYPSCIPYLRIFLDD